MKFILLLLAFSSIQLLGREVTSVCYWNGDQFETTIDTSVFEEETEWNPSKGLVPVSVNDAIKKTEEWMEEHLPNQSFYFIRVSLTNHASEQEKNHWAWLISLGNGKQSVVGEDPKGREMIERDSIDLLINMDGSILGPTKTQR